MQWSKKTVLLVVALVAAALTILPGCGSSDDSDTATATAAPLTKAEFIKKGDAICKVTEKERTDGIQAFYKKAGVPLTEALSGKQGEEMVLVAVVPALEKQDQELEALGVPDEKAAEDIMAEFDAALIKFRKLSEGGKEEGEDPFLDVNHASRKYGFQVCNNLL